MEWLAATVELQGGKPVTFGPEEDTERLPISMSFQTQIPGGFGTGSLVVARPDGLDPLSIPVRAPVTFWGPGGRVAYQGRIAAKPRFGVNEIEFELEGPSAALTDNIFRAFYVSRALSRWQAPSNQRQDDLIVANLPLQSDASVVSDETAGEALRLSTSGAWTTTVPICETWATSGTGLGIRRITGSATGLPDGMWTLGLYAADDDVATGAEGPGDIWEADGAIDIDYTFTQARRWVLLQWYYEAAGGIENGEYPVALRNLTLYGDTGLELYPSADGGAAGVRADEVLRHALVTANPEILIDYIAEGRVIPDLVYDSWDNRTLNVVEDMTELGALGAANDWGIYDSGFFWRPRGSYGTTHRLRLDEGVEIIDEGEDSAELATAIVATYSDSAGVQRAVGFPGSGADTESALLVDSDPENTLTAANAHQVITEDIGVVFSAEAAVGLAQLKLREAIRAQRTGGYRIPALAHDEPAYYCWAGDRAFVEDDFAAEQPLVMTNYDHSTGKVEVHTGGPPARFDVAQAQLARTG